MAFWFGFLEFWAAVWFRLVLLIVRRSRGGGGFRAFFGIRVGVFLARFRCSFRVWALMFEIEVI